MSFDSRKNREIVSRIIENINAGRLESARRETILASFMLNQATREFLLSKIESKKSKVDPVVQDACEILGGKISYE